jgi:DNA-binding MarR family transcriptional regulator
MKTSQVRDFRRLLRVFVRATNTQQKLCCTEVTQAQCHVLMEVDEQQRLTVSQFAARLHLDTSTLSRTIDGLVRKGLLDRSREGSDRRVVWVGLTEEGQSTCDAIHEQYDGICRDIFDKVPPAKREEVVRSFRILVQAFLDSENDSNVEISCPTRS